jgi:hypothetical protein
LRTRAAKRLLESLGFAKERLIAVPPTGGG